jgi:hypothetical protein
VRIKHTLLKVNNGWILLPDGTEAVTPTNSMEAIIFKNLKEFSEWKPKQVRRKRNTKTVTTPIGTTKHANLN